MMEDWTAALDQTRKGLTDLAGVLGAYRDALVAEGFTREEALAVVIEFQGSVYGSGGSQA